MSRINLVTQWGERVYVSVYDSEQWERKRIKRIFPEGAQLPGGSKELWHQAGALMQLSQEHGFADPDAWCIAYPLDVNEPDRAEVRTRLFEQAGFDNVYMVADVDAVMARCWLHRGGKAVERRKGVRIVRTEEDATTVTTIRMEGGEQIIHQFRAAPGLDRKALRMQCVQAWSEPDIVMFYGGKAPSDDVLWACNESWATSLNIDWQPDSLQTGMEQLGEALSWTVPVSRVWKILVDPQSDFARAALRNFDEAVAAPVFALADTRRNMDRAMGSWADFGCLRKNIVDKAKQLHRADCQTGYDQWSREESRRLGGALSQIAADVVKKEFDRVHKKGRHYNFFSVGGTRDVREKCMTPQLTDYLTNQYENYRSMVKDLGLVTSWERRHYRWRDMRGQMHALADGLKESAEAYIYRTCDFTGLRREYVISEYRRVAYDLMYGLDQMWGDMALGYHALCRMEDIPAVDAYVFSGQIPALPEKFFPPADLPQCSAFVQAQEEHERLLQEDPDYARLYTESHLP